MHDFKGYSAWQCFCICSVCFMIYETYEELPLTVILKVASFLVLMTLSSIVSGWDRLIILLEENNECEWVNERVILDVCNPSLWSALHPSRSKTLARNANKENRHKTIIKWDQLPTLTFAATEKTLCYHCHSMLAYSTLTRCSIQKTQQTHWHLEVGLLL